MASYSQVIDDFKNLIFSDSKTAALRKKIKENGTYEDVQQYAYRIGQLMSDSLVKVDNMSADDIETLTTKLSIIMKNYINGAAEYAQKHLNESGGINLATKTDVYVEDLVTQTIKSFNPDTDEATIKNRLETASTTQNLKQVDSIQSKNAKFINSNGYKVTVTRVYDNIGVHNREDTCEWCKERCGKDVPYDDAKANGMFQRHPGCGCTITYKSARGTYRQGKGEWQANNWSTQEYRIVKKGEEYTEPFRDMEVKTHKIENYDNLYISDNAILSNREVQYIYNANRKAMKHWKVKDQDMKVVILSDNEYRTGLGMYVAKTNTVYYSSILGAREKIREFNETTGDNVSYNEIQLHEMFHKKQADDHKSILRKAKNNNEYVKEVAKCYKSFVDKLEEDGYNISDLGKDAVYYRDIGRYDEVVAYYMVKEKS